MAILIIGAGLVGSQIARILVDEGERPVLMDISFQPDALGEIVALDRCVLAEGDVMRPLTLTQAIVEHGITDIIHLVAYPMLTLGAQRDPYAAIQLNILGTVNVLEAARIISCGAWSSPARACSTTTSPAANPMALSSRRRPFRGRRPSIPPPNRRSRVSA